MVAPPAQLIESSSVCPTTSSWTSCHVSTIMRKHHGSWESVQKFLSTHLRRLTHFPKVKVSGRLYSVPFTLIYSLSLSFFLTRSISPVFSHNLSLSALIFSLFSVLQSLGFSVCFSLCLFIFCFLSLHYPGSHLPFELLSPCIFSLEYSRGNCVSYRFVKNLRRDNIVFRMDWIQVVKQAWLVALSTCHWCYSHWHCSSMLPCCIPKGFYDYCYSSVTPISSKKY